MIERLLADHDRLRDFAARLYAMIDEGAPEPDRLADVRWQLGRHMLQHVALEDRHVYANLAADPNPQAAAIGRRFHEDYRRYMTEYIDHAKHWTPERIATGWLEYARRTRKLLDALIQRIDDEERELFPAVRSLGLDTATGGVVSHNWTRDAFQIKDAIHPTR